VKSLREFDYFFDNWYNYLPSYPLYFFVHAINVLNPWFVPPPYLLR